MKTSKFLGVVFTIAFVIVFVIGIAISAGCTTEPEEPGEVEGKVYELSFCVQHPYQDPMVCVINEAQKKWLWDESDGRIEVTIIPSAGAVSSASELFDAARTGIVDIACHSGERTAGRFTLTDVISLPGMVSWPSSLQVGLTLRALYEKYPEIQAEYAGVHMLTFHSSSVSVPCSIKEPIETMEDFEGKMVRVGGEYRIKSYEALGATTMDLDPGEWYDAGAKGVYDVFDGNFQCLIIFGVFDLINYANTFPNGADFFIHLMNEDSYNNLPADLQALLTWDQQEVDTKIFGWKFNLDEYAAKEALEAKFADAGLPPVYDLPAAEEARWLDKVKPIWDMWLADAEAKGAPAQAILDDCVKFCEQYSYESMNPDMSSILAGWEALPSVPE